MFQGLQGLQGLQTKGHLLADPQMHEALKEVKEEGPNASGAQFNVKF